MAIGTNEKILLNYLHSIEYDNDALNAIGATTSLLRTVPTPGGDIAYVRKFGTPYLITDVTDIEDPIDVNMTFKIYALDGTLLGSRVGGGAYADGEELTTAQGCYMEIEADGGDVVVLAGIDVDTDVDAGGLTFVCAAETITDGDTLRLYLSDTSSTYYDSNHMHGGDRHTPALGNTRLPYFTLTTAEAACADANDDGVEVVDSETYDEQLDLDLSQFAIYASAGQTPTITSGVGARVTREQVNQGNNSDTAYVSKTGNDGNPGTYQEPYLTHSHAFTNRGARTYINTMDNNVYPESFTLNAAITMEPLYGQTPLLTNTSTILTLTISDVKIYGYRMQGFSPNYDILFGADNLTVYIEDCTFYDSYIGIQASDKTLPSFVRRCYFSNNNIGIHTSETGVHTFSGRIEYNIFASNNYGMFIEIHTLSGQIWHNLCYNNSTGILVNCINEFASTAKLENNTSAYNIDKGIHFQAVIVDVVSEIRDNIFYHNTTWDLYRPAGAAATITESNYGTNSGFTIGAGCITSDPRFCKTTAPYKLGLSANSEAIKADSTLDDMGVHLRCIEINNSDITVNGFYIDGQEQYNNAIYIIDVADHTGTIIKWNSLHDFQGIGLDPYDNDVDTDCIITNNKIYNNGNGIKLSYGGNTVQENLIYNNTIYGIFSERTTNGIIHNVFHGHQYGLYLESTSSGITIRDNIFSGNSLYDIYSEIAVIPTYCCIEGAVNSNVDTTSDTNKLTDPLFVDAGNADFNIKTTEAGYLIDSQCKDVASDGQDIGAWNMSRAIAEEAWRKYQLAWNPRKLDPEYNGKGVTKFENALGMTKMFEKGHLRVLPFQWSRTQASTEELWKKIQYLSSLVPDRDQGRTEDQCRIRVNPLPSQLILSGTNATISAATKTIIDTTIDLTEDELKGYWASIKFLSGTDMTIDAALKTGTVAGTPWTVNEHVGRYIHDSGFYYRVLSNTVNVVTLSDPNDTLTNGIIDYAFEKYFKMIKTENQILHLEDEDGEMPTGSYDYYVDFIEMHVVKPGFKTIQERFYWLQETWKTGFSLFLEEL